MRLGRSIRALAVLAAAIAPLPAAAAPRCPTQALNRTLLAADSATAVLQQVCSGRGDARIAARALANRPDPTPPAWVRAALRPRGGEPVQYRRVELMCGPEVLSAADNWYLPAQLTPAMNHSLMSSQKPFGVVVRPLRFHRRTLAVQQLTTCGAWPGHGAKVLRHRAVLIDRPGHPFSVVQETYTGAALAP